MSQTPATRLKIALAQANPIVGDIDANIAKLRGDAGARRAGADLIVFPELFVTGYPPEDLVLKPAFQTAARERVEAFAAEIKDGPAVLTGTVWPEGGKVYNAVALLDAGKVVAVRFKVDLPNYGVFDEKRVFAPGPMPGPDELPRRASRRADLRGHLGSGRHRVPRRVRRRDPHQPQRLALRLDEARRAHEPGGRARHRDAGCRSPISTRSAARTSSCSTAPPSCSTPAAVSPRSSPLGRRRSP